MKRILYVVILVLAVLLAGCGSKTPSPDPNAHKPSNPGGVGQAVSLKGDAVNGEKIFSGQCAQCHGPQGTGGVANPGGTEAEVPALNPVDESMKNKDVGIFAANLDLFLEHGSTPEGSPTKIMVPYGDSKVLAPQDIADVIAYIISLNK